MLLLIPLQPELLLLWRQIDRSLVVKGFSQDGVLFSTSRFGGLFSVSVVFRAESAGDWFLGYSA